MRAPALACVWLVLSVARVSAQPVSFTPARNFSTGDGPAAVATGDFNGDAKMDLAVTNRNANTVSVFLGTGTGSFGDPTNFAVQASPVGVAIGDFNEDSKLDLAVANFSGHTVSILLGFGNGSFADAVSFVVNAPYSLAVADFNGDGHLDLAVGNTSSRIFILLGTGTGSFGSPIGIDGSAFGNIWVTAADFNGDGKQDLAVAPGASPNPQFNIQILLGTGTGTFASQGFFQTGRDPVQVAVGDFNSDGKADLAVACTNNGVSVLLGTGTGTFGAPTSYTAGNGPYFVAVGDLNGDGHLDLAVANNSGVDKMASVLVGSGTGTFSAPQNFAVGANSRWAALSDFNGDGRLDLVVTNENDDTISVLLNTTGLAIATLTIAKTGAGTGTVTSNPIGINCGADCQEAYGLGTMVIVSPAPASGSFFSGWGGDCTGTDPCVVTMTADRTATATFAPTAFTFTDEELIVGDTIKAAHVAELRQAVNTMRAAHGLSQVTFTDATLTARSTPVKAVHVTELRAALDAVYAAVARPAPVYTDQPVAATATTIKRIHILELRQAVRALE